MKNLQTVMMIIFGVFIIFGVMAFAGILPSPQGSGRSDIKGKITIWGTIPKAPIENALKEGPLVKYNRLVIKYTEIKPEIFEDRLIEALAAAAAPDMVILPDNLLIRFKNHIAPFSYEIFSERQFKDTFIEGGNIFVKDEKVLALPVWVDPMVMYWNKDMFVTNGVARPPVYWDEFLTVAPILTKRNDANDILKSAISFGEFRNVDNAKEIFATLLLQTGNPIIRYISASGIYESSIAGGTELKIPSADTSLRFYTDFANPLKPIYSWNRSLQKSKNAFLAGDLSTYFGFASEAENIRVKNPNLNFDVAPMPQIRTANYKAAYGKVGGIAVLKTSKQQPQSFFVARFFSGAELSKDLAERTKMPPPLTGLLAVKQKNALMQTFYDAALISRTWNDINPVRSSTIFQTTIEAVISGQLTVSEAVLRAESEMAAIAKKTI